MVDSRRKGATNERRLVQLLNDAGFRAKRCIQSQPDHDVPDVLLRTPTGAYCIEAKDHKGAYPKTIHKWFEQAQSNRLPGSTAFVAIHRPGTREHLVVIDLKDLMRLMAGVQWTQSDTTQD